MKQFFNILLIAFFTYLNALVAQTNSDTLATYDSSDSIVVVANRYKASIKNMAYNYQVIKRDQILSLSNHSALEVVDHSFPSSFLLEKKTMGFGVGTAGAGLLNLRGLGGKPNTGVLVLINGHPDFMGIFGHPLPDVYGIDDIHQVEVLAGPASTVFGDHAMGGVVNLVTLPDYSQLLRLSVEGGTYNSYRYGLNVSRNFGKMGMYLNARRQKSDGHIERSGFESTHIMAGISMQLNPNYSLYLHGRYVPYRFDDPSRGLNDPAGIGTYGDIERSTAELILRNNHDRWQGSAQIYGNFGQHRFYDGFKSNDHTYGLSIYQNAQLIPQLSLAFGTDIMQFGGQAENPFAFLPNGRPVVNDEKHQINSAGAYALGLYNPLPYLNLKAGIRYQYHSVSNDNWAPVGGITLNLVPSLKLYANYQNGFRNPTPMELYLFPTANDQLSSEKVNSFEIGSVYNWSTIGTAQLSYFRNRVENLIQTIPNPTPPPMLIFSNSGEADQWGLESMIKIIPNRQTILQLSHSYLDPGPLTAFNPRNQYKYLLSASGKEFRFSIYGKYVSTLYTGNNSTLKVPDYHVLNMSIALLTKHYDLHLRVLNILNKKYQILPGYPAPGTNARFGIDVKL